MRKSKESLAIEDSPYCFQNSFYSVLFLFRHFLSINDITSKGCGYTFIGFGYKKSVHAGMFHFLIQNALLISNCKLNKCSAFN